MIERAIHKFLPAWLTAAMKGAGAERESAHDLADEIAQIIAESHDVYILSAHSTALQILEKITQKGRLK